MTRLSMLNAALFTAIRLLARRNGASLARNGGACKRSVGQGPKVLARFCAADWRGPARLCYNMIPALAAGAPSVLDAAGAGVRQEDQRAVTPSEVQALVARCLEGDDAARACFYAEYSEIVERAAYSRLARMTGQTPERADVEDIRNDVFERMLFGPSQPLRQLHKPGSITAWLAAVAGNRAVDWLRREVRRDQAHADLAREEKPVYAANPEQNVLSKEITHAVEACLAELPPQDRLVLELYFVHGLKHVQIAEVMGLNLNTASARLRRAKLKLRNVLRGSCHGSHC